MSDETSEKRSSSTGWVVGVLAALFLYVLSPGPVVFLMMKGVLHESPTVTKMLDAGFWPLRKLYENYKPVKKLYDAYFKALGIS